MGIYGTRTSDYWSCQPAKMDALNLRHLYPSTTPYGIPDLERCDYRPTDMAAWNVARQREYAADNGGIIHFFLDDYRFESVWSSPERLLPRVLQVGATLTPDFSLWRDMPHATSVWNVYRSRWCGAYWQANGIQVIPTACWAREDTFAYCFDGIPSGGPVAISSVGLRAASEDRGLFRAGVEHLLWLCEPSALLVYGRLRHCDGLDLPEVVEYPTFWDRRRKHVVSREEGQ